MRRHRSFLDEDALYQTLKREVPDKIDIGAIFNAPPSNKDQVISYKPQERELIFDIDANDYDDVRFCSCKGTPSVCVICWKLIETAISILDSALKQDFGFEKVFWFFSGRRGVHCWVCDHRARILTAEARSAIVSYLSVEETRDNDTGHVRLQLGKKDLHPSLERAKKFIDKYIKTAICDYDMLNNPNIAKLIQNYLPPNLFEAMSKEESSVDKWKALKKAARADEKHLITSLKFCLAYPRLDMEVSKQMNHLLKSPFIVHPGTGKISVPIDSSDLSSFELDKVPTVYHLINETDKSNSVLRPYIKMFKNMVLQTTIDSSLENKNKMDMSW